MKVFLAIASMMALANAKVFFHEKFENDDKWKTSAHKDDYGKFELTAGKFYGDENDKGYQTSQDAKFYASSAKFDKFSNEGKDLVVQLSVKHEQNIDCGGGYVKLFPSALTQTDMHGESEYNIMFGPDICGPGTKKVHAIFNYKGKNHLINKEVRCKDDVFTHIYTLIVKPDQSYEILIDNKSEQTGTLMDDWDMLPPKKIKDPEAKKPSQEEWDEREEIPDADDTKPEDWDKPEHIADPDATKPEDWDDEMDGEWEPPMVDNPDYKGEWKPKMIKNPDFKGKWVHPEIDNPDYDASEAKTLGQFADFGAIGIDIWQVKSGTIFDNILLTDDVDFAKTEAEAILKLAETEKKMKEEQDAEEEKKAAEEVKDSTPVDDDEEDEDLDDEEDAEDADDKANDHDEL